MTNFFKFLLLLQCGIFSIKAQNFRHFKDLGAPKKLQLSEKTEIQPKDEVQISKNPGKIIPKLNDILAALPRVKGSEKKIVRLNNDFLACPTSPPLPYAP